MKVFLSFNHGDREIAQQVTKSLKSNGIEVSSLAGTQAGENWPAKLEQDLRDSDEMVVLLTDKSQQSNSVIWEIGFAVGMKKPVVIIELGAKSELKSNLGTVQYVRYSNLDVYLKGLRKRLAEKALHNKRGKSSKAKR